MIDKKFFYEQARKYKFFGKLSQKQVDSMDYIINHWDCKGYKDKRWLAYIFATVFHETARTMLPIEEIGKGKSRPYGKKFKHSGIPYTTPNKYYYGRGFVQLTWYENYEQMSRILYGDLRLLVEPELALDVKVATEIMFEGMTKGSSSFGDFTGKCLEQYINSKGCDYVGARKIINGKDKNMLIAGYAIDMEKCLKQAA